MAILPVICPIVSPDGTEGAGSPLAVPIGKESAVAGQDVETINRNGREDALKRAMIDLVDGMTRHGQTTETAVPGLFVTKLQWITPASTSLYEPCVSLLLQGRKKVMFGDREVIYDPQHFLLASTDIPALTQAMEADPARPYLAVSFLLDLNIVRDMLADMNLDRAGPRVDAPCITTLPVTVDLLDVFSRLLKVAQYPPDVPFMAHHLQRELIYRLLQVDRGGRLRDIALGDTQSHRAATAIAWLRLNYAQSVRMKTLAEMAGMGVSTLHRHFREMTSMSPLQYQKALRLHEGRRLMLAERFSVGRAAHRVGYESQSQFCRDYRRLFGDAPRSDIHRLMASHPFARDDRAKNRQDRTYRQRAAEPRPVVAAE